MTDPASLVSSGCDPAAAAVIAADIDFGWSDAAAYCGPAFADFQARAIEEAINNQHCDVSALEQVGIMPELALAITGAIKAKRTRR
ncbi:hypothetical protein [Bradyrhizobium japonicum]|uniref:hypothetical protein n=1 Tax=Bradyrhizobium japonicum TaxID=375 RepID=UPI00040B1420|nr:hypothetical protein [Bradyrhizobium japonicum]